MFGMSGTIVAHPGQRDALLAILLEGAWRMHEVGAYVYVVGTVPDQPDAVYVTEVWQSKAAHDGSLQLDATKDAIARARPLIAGFENSMTFTPVGGTPIPVP